MVSSAKKGTEYTGFYYSEMFWIRKIIYEFLGAAFYYKLTMEQLDSLGRSTLPEIFSELADDDEIPGVWELRESLSVKNDSENTLAILRQDYQALFEGPGRLLAPPWESVYLSSKKLLFEAETAEVREWYRKHGLQTRNHGKEPEDHIGIELQFMAYLAGLSLTLLENKEISEFKLIIQEQIDFLEMHLLKWADKFAHKVQSGAITLYYKSLGLFLPWYLKYDFDLISSFMLNQAHKEVNL